MNSEPEMYAILRTSFTNYSGKNITENLGLIKGNVVTDSQLKTTTLTFAQSLIYYITGNYSSSNVTYEINLDTL